MQKNALAKTPLSPLRGYGQPPLTAGVTKQNSLPADTRPPPVTLTADQEPFKVTELDAGSCRFAMNLPASCCNLEFISLVLGHAGSDDLPGKPLRLGIDGVELQNGQLHVTGRRAREALEHLAKVLNGLPTLGVGSPGQPGVLDVLGATPALMTVPKVLNLVQEGDGDQIQLEGDRSWVASVLDQLTVRWPSLAFNLFDRLTPGLRNSLLRHCPAIIDSLVAKASRPQDRQALSGYFVAGLSSELKPDGDLDRIQTWIEHCPRWAAASLLRVWDDHADSDAKAQWMLGRPDLQETLAVLRDSGARPEPSVMKDDPRVPDLVLELLRKKGIPEMDGPLWNTGMRYINSELREILLGTLTDVEREASYRNVVEVLNLLPTDERGALLLHSVLHELASQFRRGEEEDGSMTWLLERLSKDYAHAFSEATACAFRANLSEPKATRLQLQADPQGRYAGVDCADREHLRKILKCMGQRVGTDPASQESLTLLHDTSLLGAPPPVHQILAPDDLSKAHWRAQYLFRDKFAKQLGKGKSLEFEDAIHDPHIQCEVYASILHQAAHDKQTPIESAEIAGFATFIANGQPSRSLFNWLSALLKRYPDDKSYTALVANMVLSAAGRLYTQKAADPNARVYADGLMAWLCYEEAVPVVGELVLDRQLLEKEFTKASAAWTPDTLKGWQDKLTSGSRAVHRAGVLMATLKEAFGSHSVV